MEEWDMIEAMVPIIVSFILSFAFMIVYFFPEIFSVSETCLAFLFLYRHIIGAIPSNYPALAVSRSVQKGW